MSGVLTARNHVIVTRGTRSYNLVVIGARRFPCVCGVAAIAIGGCLNMASVLAGGLSAVVATKAVSDYACMVHLSGRKPGGSGVALLAFTARWNMR